MGNTVKFNGCKHLDFSNSYAAKKNAINSDGQTKACWNRPVIDETYPSLVQFCKLRGRLNNPESCLCERNKQCSDYVDMEHEVEVVE